MRAIFEALVILAVVLIAAISCGIAYSVNQPQIYPNSTITENNKPSTIENDTTTTTQPTENESTIPLSTPT